MNRILIGECKQEISSFNPLLGQYEDFSITRGDERVSCHRGVRSEMAGALTAFCADGDVKPVPGYSARGITSCGTLAGPAFSQITTEFLQPVRLARAVDGIYFAFHGSLAEVDGTAVDPEQACQEFAE